MFESCVEEYKIHVSSSLHVCHEVYMLNAIFSNKIVLDDKQILIKMKSILVLGLEHIMVMISLKNIEE